MTLSQKERGLSKAGRARAASMARSMPKDARRCILNWGDKKTPVPDSVWHGCYSGLMWRCGACSFTLSPLGLAVRDILTEEQKA